MSDDSELIPAATVLLLRDPRPEAVQGSRPEAVQGSLPEAVQGPEVLMLRRNSRIAFGGMWVFPGGRVDDGDAVAGDPIGSARRAAVREVKEETGLDLDVERLSTWSYWIPPPAQAMATRGPQRRFATWFFVAPAPDGDVRIDHGEIHEYRWLSASDGQRQQRDGAIELAPPTWISLHQLGQHRSTAEALAWAEANEPSEFRTRPIGGEPVVLAWSGDSAYETGAVDGPGARNRLIMDPNGWRYELASA